MNSPIIRDRDSRPIRMGFVLDVAGYGSRTRRARKRVQERLVTLIGLILDDLNVHVSETDQQGTGDGVLLFLPKDLDTQHALPVLLHSIATRLAEDNDEFGDQVRLRMAVDIGPVGLAPLGFEGTTATNLGRLVDSEPLREWLGNPGHDLAVVVTDRLHSFVVAEDVPALPQDQFTRVSVRIKEFATEAWLWDTGDPARHRRHDPTRSTP
jgi:hypothetical protein